MKNGRLNSGQVVGRLFKKATKSARQQGEARVMFEDMVYRAERKLAEAERKAVGDQNSEEKAEALAKELFHKPGSMLTAEELAHMNQETNCSNIRPIPSCFDPITWVYRTIDGTCNNLKKPLFGASDTAFTRLIPAQYEDHPLHWETLEDTESTIPLIVPLRILLTLVAELELSL